MDSLVESFIFVLLQQAEKTYRIMSDDIFEQNEQDNNDTEFTAEAERIIPSDPGSYNDEAIQTLKWNEHIRRRPGMYIGKLGDGSHAEDGIYVLIKEVVDNSIDEFNMGAGKRIDITLTEEGEVTVRDYGRGIPLGKVKEVASDINTGGKFDDKNFKKSVGLNGVGLKAVNALSVSCTVSSVRDGKMVVRLKGVETQLVAPSELKISGHHNVINALWKRQHHRV